MAGASGASITLSQDAANAAGKSYAIVKQAYSRGAVGIVTLLDAQNAALVTEQVAANSVYDSLLDLMRVARAAGGFKFVRSAMGCDEHIRGFLDFAKKAQP